MTSAAMKREPRKPHALAYRYEERLSHLGISREVWNGGDKEKQYPCPIDCKNLHGFPKETAVHTGVTRLIYAYCLCGWEHFSGDHIHESEAILEGRLLHLQHQIEELREAANG